MQILRILILQEEGGWFVALALEQDVVGQARSIVAAIKDLGEMFDWRDRMPNAMPPLAAPRQYALLWETGKDLGEYQLGAVRRGRVRQ